MTVERSWSEEDGCLMCPVRHHGLCAKLPDRVLGRVAALARHVDYAADTDVWDAPVRGGFIGILRRGYLRIQRRSSTGRRQIIAMVSPGELIDEAIEARDGYRFEASTDAALCRFEREAFDRLMAEEPDLRRAVLQQYVERLEDIRRLAWSFGFKTEVERFCAFLVHACGVMPYQPLPDGSAVLTLETPTADIADLLGITVASTARITRRLERDGLVTVRSARHLVLRDLGRLAEIGGVNRDTVAQPATRRHSRTARLQQRNEASVPTTTEQDLDLSARPV